LLAKILLLINSLLEGDPATEQRWEGVLTSP